MITTHRASSPADFLAVLPAMLGHQPIDSVVVVPMTGSRSLGAMRLDLVGAERAAELARVAMGLVCKVEDATGLVLVVYGDHTRAAAVGAQVAAQAAACGVQLLDQLHVADGMWGVIGEDATEPVPATPAHLAAMLTAADQHAGAVLPLVGEALTSAVALSLRSDLPTALALQGGEPLDVLERALGWDGQDLEPAEVAILSKILNRPALRDVALVQWCHGFAAGQSAMDAQIAWEAGATYPERLAAVMWGEGPRPDARRLLTALTACRYVAALCPAASQVGPLAAAAWLSWALGRSTHADAYSRQALAIDPAHGLSQIVGEFVAAGHLPEFAFSR